MHGFSLMYNIVISYFALFLHDDCIFCLCKRAQLSYTVQNAEVATHKKVSRNCFWNQQHMATLPRFGVEQFSLPLLNLAN